MTETFPYKSEEIKARIKKNILLYSILCFLSLILIVIFIVVQNRKNSLIFFILMLLVMLVSSFFIVKFLTLNLPTYKQLLFYCKRNEISPTFVTGTFIRFGNNIIVRNIEAQEAYFKVGESEVCFYFLSDSKQNLIVQNRYTIKHGNLFIFAIEEARK